MCDRCSECLSGNWCDCTGVVEAATVPATVSYPVAPTDPVDTFNSSPGADEPLLNEIDRFWTQGRVEELCARRRVVILACINSIVFTLRHSYSKPLDETFGDICCAVDETKRQLSILNGLIGRPP